LTGRKLVAIAETIAVGTPKRKPMGQIKELLAAAAREGHIKRELMKNELATELDWPDTRQGTLRSKAEFQVPPTSVRDDCEVY
jgi:hypothetical protein